MKITEIQQYKKKITHKIAVMGLSTLSLSIFVSTGVFADAKSQILSGSDATGQSGGPTLQQGIENVTGVLLFLIGTISVIAIIIGGIRYTTSNGDASQTKAAKDTIMYAVIGLVVAILAYAIVKWVVGAFAAR